MCGIAGIVRNYPDPADTLRVRQMLVCVQHRGPDSDGISSDGNGLAVLGHKRLAIIDLSDAGRQPMSDAASGACLVLNGEIYNYIELRAELERFGHRFRTRTDTEVVLNGFLHWGERVVDHLVGMFAFAMWEPAERKLTLARDRLGEKPLYYASDKSGFAFASELGALRGFGTETNTIDRNALGLYLSYQYVPAPYSIYANIFKLPPAHILCLQNGAYTVRRYWDPLEYAGSPQLRLSEAEAVDSVEQMLLESVKGQMISDVPLGAFLSGGIDSSLVVSVMQELSPEPVRTFTIGFESERHNEADFASAVAAKLGTQHTTEYFTERDTLQLIHKLPEMYSEPFGDESALPTHLLSMIARKVVTVSLSGDGGDELFGGYSRYSWLETATFLNRLGGGSVAGAADGLRRYLPERARRASGILGLRPKDTYRALVSVFTPGEVSRLIGRVPVWPEFERAWDTMPDKSIRQRAMACDILTYLPEAILTKVDRAAMAVSLETRIPMLDHRLVEFALRLPHHLVKNKRLLKLLAFRRVGKPLLDRPKKGFGLPVAEWFRGPLREEVLDTLTGRPASDLGLDDPEFIARLVHEHVSGRENHAARLWSLFVLSGWMHHNETRSRGITS